MTQHFSTTVIPAAVINEPVSTPVLALGADSEDGIAGLALPTALHLMEPNRIMAFTHTTPVSGLMPVSDAWVAACCAYGDEFTGEAKVALILEPVPADIETTWAGIEEGVPHEDLPPWMTSLIRGELRCATRDVRVTSGSILQLNVMPAPETLEDWAERIL